MPDPSNSEQKKSVVDKNYNKVHQYIRRNWQPADFCTQCGNTEPRRYEWANVTGVYSKNLEDYLPMCVPCHRSFDYSDYQKDIHRERLKVQKIASKGKVAQYKDGKLLAVHDSAGTAARAVGVSPGTLREYLVKDWKHVAGYQWERLA